MITEYDKEFKAAQSTVKRLINKLAKQHLKDIHELTKKYQEEISLIEKTIK